MKLAVLLTASAAVSVFANSVSACEPALDERTLSEIRSLSKPVAVDRLCRTINAGVYDNLSLGPVTDLGNGRIQQVLDGSDQSTVLVADCNTSEATILLGAVTTTDDGNSCGPTYTFADLAGENAMMSLAAGADLHELVDLALAQGATEINPLEYFFMFSKAWESDLHPVPRKDRFNLLCGCQLYYPQSAGAKE
jgi:hypothetical protein